MDLSEIPLCALKGAVSVEGALMELSYHKHWQTSPPAFEIPAGYKNPPLKEFLDATGVKDWGDTMPLLEFGCTDGWILKPEKGGKLLLVKRKEPKDPPGPVHTAPMNGFRWPIGGRIRLYPGSHPMCDSFGLIQSFLVKIEQEAGISPEMIDGIYELGISRLWFNNTMTYYHSGPEESDRFVEEVQMINPVRTISTNYVVVLREGVADTLRWSDRSVADPLWISEAESWNPMIRNSFCSYVQDVAELVLYGWREKLKGKRPK